MFYIFPNIVSKKECKRFLKLCIKNTKFYDAVVKGSCKTSSAKEYDKTRFDSDIRKTDVAFLAEKNDRIHRVVYSHIHEANNIHFNYKIDWFEAIQFARYQNGGFYNWHQDDSGKTSTGELRKLSLTFCLTDPDTYEGGDLEFYKGGLPLPDIEMSDGTNLSGSQVQKNIRAQGTIVVFDSYDWHRVTPVTKGIRYSIVCWTRGPNFI